MSEPTLAVTATINLRGLRAGENAIVDPHDPYIAELLSASYLIPNGSVVAVEEQVEQVDPIELPEAETTLMGLEELPLGDADVLSLDSA